MSRSNNTDVINPATRYFEWSGGKKGKGFLSYWDKDAKERIKIDLPFRFLVLDKVFQVGGGIGKGKDYQGFWSNCIRDSRTEIFTVKSKNGVYAEGLWKEIKDKHTAWVTGLYIAFYGDDKTLQIGYLKLEGAANSSWIDFTSDVQRDIYKGVFSITASEFVDGEIEFYKPVYGWSEKITDETNEAATQLDAEILQPYLKSYFALERSETSQADREYTSDKEFYEDEPEMPEMGDAYEAPEDDDIAF